ncbi:ParB/RepB/Spo0J family partition protein [Echinicola vietnamensis]|uniref:ParB-like partition protein n=1 Tax=Echinicola vietnamensis (strain DSM 17526 / LMG 23754 / KMM 6221) TaxID=926556 RepID=L0G1C4_ECHVK|nr:ParB/RepB/Spo0J family partition protein [Echinicola vietnamensis]AGA78645.1 ParB-like partition protein [Echinicola vietnamensis DSM 17526]
MADNKKTTTNKKKALGRGLGALLQDSPNKEPKDEVQEQARPEAGIYEIPLDEIQVNPYQPRTHFDKDALQELADSITVQGIIQPITVRKLSDNEYQLISGERRFQASKLAGLTMVPAYVRTANDQQMLEMALIENIQRENLNALEIAHSYQRLLSECELKQEQLGDRVGKNRTTVNNYLRLLKLPPDIQAGIRDKKISMGHARALINVEDVDKQLAIYRKTLEEELSVRKVEALVKALHEDGEEEKTISNKPDLDPVKKYELGKLQQKLASHLGTKVSLKMDHKDKGEIKIPFGSTDDLNRILEILEII